MNQLENARKILDVAIEKGMAEITPNWNIYTREYIEQGKMKNLDDQNPFHLNRLITMKGGVKCPFVILPSDISGAYDIFKLPSEKMAHFQVFSILFNGEPDRLEDY
jgi:hypothetical protein